VVFHSPHDAHWKPDSMERAYLSGSHSRLNLRPPIQSESV